MSLIGRIKTAQIKTLGKELVESYPEKFSVDFDENKRALEDADIESKWVRNRLAGYITTLMKRRE